MASAPTGVNAPENSASTAFPELPGDDLYAHAATQHLEQLDAFLTGKELLVVAQGGESDAVRQIVDFDVAGYQDASWDATTAPPSPSRSLLLPMPAAGELCPS